MPILGCYHCNLRVTFNCSSSLSTGLGILVIKPPHQAHVILIHERGKDREDGSHLCIFSCLCALSFYSYVSNQWWLTRPLPCTSHYAMLVRAPLCLSSSKASWLMRMLLLILLFIQKLQSGTPPGEGRDCCSWDGVECDIDTGHVIGLNLGGSCLYGTINSSNSLLHYWNWLSLISR